MAREGLSSQETLEKIPELSNQCKDRVCGGNAFVKERGVMCKDPEVGARLGVFEEWIRQPNEKDHVCFVWLKSGQGGPEVRLVR